MAEDRVALPLVRGTIEGADCSNCPLALNGMPHRPVCGEGTEDPKWIIIGEGPGAFEVNRDRCFIGPSGQVVNQVLGKIGVDRSTLWITNSTLCMPPSGTDVPTRERAAQACSGRLMAELARFPGIPILTLGAVAARAVIPKPVLDAIDPPETIKALKKAQKYRQQPTIKAARARRKAIAKEAERRLRKLISHHRKSITTIYKVRHRARAPEHVLVQEVLHVQAKLERKANEDAIKAIDLKARERKIKAIFKASQPKAKKKHKQVKITDICGSLFDIDVDGTGIRPVIPAIHPAALLRGGGASIGGSHTPDMAFVNLMYDAGKANSLANGKDIRLRLNVEYELTDEQRAGELFLRVYHSAIEEGACSIDLETYVDDPDRHHALMAYMARVKVIGIATKTMAVSLAWGILPAWAMSLLQVLLGQVDCGFHNGLYDRTVLRAYGFVFQGEWTDTLLGHHAAFPGNSHRLQIVTSQFFGVAPWKSEYRANEETDEKLAIYNAKDTGATHALRAPLALWRKRTKTERVYDLDRKMSDCASRMHLAGMPIDRDINSELLTTFAKNVAESRRHVEDIARDPKRRELIWHYLAVAQAGKARKLDPPDFEARYNLRLEAMGLDPDWKWKIGAGKHIAALLQAMGVQLHQTTEGGEISTKKDVLESLVGFPIVRDILAYRENDKLLSTFIWPAFDRHDSKTGEITTHGFADDNCRIHPIWNVHRISGRWASQWPVVSNVPKDKWKKLGAEDLLALGIFELAEGQTKFLVGGQLYRFNTKDKSYSKMVRPNLRRQIRARKGRIFVGFDFGQIEARVIALISGDPFLCAIFAEGRDPHIECARIIWPHFDSLDPDTRKQLRENVKNIEYGAMYMAQLDTLHQTMLKAGNLIEKADLARAIAALLKAMAGVVTWQHSTIARASAPPYEIRDFVLGRRRTWPMGQVEGTEAVNYGVQTAAASIMNTGMANMMEVIDDYREVDPIAQIHDAAIFECWEDDASRLAEDVTKAFTQAYERDGRSIPFPIDVKIGQSWDSV